MFGDDALRIPILRGGRDYASLDLGAVKDIRTGAVLADVGQANAGLIRRDLRLADARAAALRAVPLADRLGFCRRAGELFMQESLPLAEDGPEQSPEDYVAALSRTSGLPHTLCRANMAKIHAVLTGMPDILRGLTRGMDPAVVDTLTGEHDGIPVCYTPLASALGVILPSNSPGVNSLWMPAIALGVPVVLKPGREEPWTPLRIARALLAAGCPPEVLSLYPTDHEGAAAILQGAGRALLFGDSSTTAPYEKDPRVQIHGPGHSKVLLGPDEADAWQEHLDVLVESVALGGGRSCINASTILTPRHGSAIAGALAERLAARRPLPPEDPDAALPAFANPQIAEAIDAAITRGITAGGAEDVTAALRGGERLQVLDGACHLLPTVVRCDSLDHPLARTEYLFPFVSVVEVPAADLVQSLGPSLVVTAITRAADLQRRLLACPLVDRLNLGPVPTTRVEWNQPHEGNLFEFLFQRRAIQREAGW